MKTKLITGSIILIASFFAIMSISHQSIGSKVKKANEILTSNAKFSEKKDAIKYLNDLYIEYGADSICPAFEGLFYTHITNIPQNVKRETIYTKLLACKTCNEAILNSFHSQSLKRESYEDHNRKGEISAALFSYFKNRSIGFLDSIDYINYFLDIDSAAIIFTGGIENGMGGIRSFYKESIIKINNTTYQRFSRFVSKGYFKNYMTFNRYEFCHNVKLVLLIAEHYGDILDYTNLQYFSQPISIALRGYYGCNSLTNLEKDSIEKKVLPRIQRAFDHGPQGCFTYSIQLLSSFQVNKDKAIQILIRIRDAYPNPTKAQASAAITSLGG